MRHKLLQFLAAGGLLLLPAAVMQGKPPASAAYSGAGTGRITASFSGLQGRSGFLRVSLFDAKNFPDGVPLAHRDVALQALGAKVSLPTVTFAGLRPGTYAVCAFHDRSGSGKMTVNILGIPQEEWGMSGNPNPLYRAPRFDEAKLSLNAREQKTISIMLHIQRSPVAVRRRSLDKSAAGRTYCMCSVYVLYDSHDLCAETLSSHNLHFSFL